MKEKITELLEYYEDKMKEIEREQRIFRNDYNAGKLAIIRGIIRKIQAILHNWNDRWIDYAEEEPAKNGNYLIQLDDGYMATSLWDDDDFELWADAGEVVAWRYLPKGWKAE